MILLGGVAPCTAMVFVWSQLSRGDANYTLVQVSINDIIMIFAFAPIAGLLPSLTDITVPWDTLLLSVLLYVVIPLVAGAYTRYSDDITISFKEDSSQKVAQVIKFVEGKLAENGFKLNKKKGKINVLRPHQAQRICGVTINSGKPTISRKQRRLIRAAEHNAKQGKPTTFSEDQIEGHQSFQAYIKEHGELLSQNERIEYLKDGSISARGCKANKGYIILKGSRFDASKIGELKKELKPLFDELVNDGVIVEKEKGIAKFICNHQFKSKTLATSLLYMRNVRPIGRWS